METIQLQLTHTFGSTCSLNFKNSLAICDQDKNQPKIVFPAGKTLARKYIDRAEMDFVEFSQTTQFVQCITVLPTKTHCAVVQKPFHSSLQLIKIYKMDQKTQPHTIKIFNQSDKVGIIKDIVFSPSQPKFMCAFLGQPHNKLIFIDTSRNKPLAQSNFTISNIEILTICPQNSHLICLSGGNFLKLFKIEQYAFKPLEEIRKFPKGRTITGHAWYQGKKIIAATDKCEILLIEQIKPNVYEVRQEYHNVFNEQTYDNIRISCICPFSKGFILGSNLGKFCLWTRKEDLINTPQSTQKLQLTRKWATTAQRQAQVNSISINRKQDLLLISLSNNDIAVLSLNQIIPQISDMLKQTQQKQINFQYLYKGFHSKPITGMSICQQRPLFATISSQDSTIRVWNYKSPSCKLLRMFYFKIKTELSQQERPLITLAFHPSGYYMAVGCSDKLRMFHLMNNELRPFKEVGIRQVKNVKFSNGGHYLAVGHQFTDELEIDYLRVYNALTLQEVFVFKENQAYIKQISWKSYDEVLSCLYENGVLVEFRVLDWTVSKKVTRKQLQFCCSTFNHPSNSTIVYSFNPATQSNLLQQYFPQPTTSPRTLEIDLKISKMLQVPLSKQRSSFLLALSNGTLTTLTSLQSHSISSYQNHHIGPITEMLLSPCGGYLITCGRDGLVFVYEVGVFSGNAVVKRELGSSVVDDFLGDVVLVNKRQVQKYTEKEKEFTRVISSLSKKLKMLSQQGQKKHLKNISELEIQKNRIIQDIKYRISKVSEQIQQLKQKNDSSLSQLDTKGLSQIQVLQKNYEDKISFQEQKYFQLQQQLIQLKVLHQKKLEQLHKEEEEQVARLKGEFQSKFRQSQSIFSQTKHQTHQATNIFQLRLQQIQEQQQQQIRQLQAKRHKFKLQTAALLQQLHQKLQKLKKQYSTLQKQRTQVKLQNQELVFQKKKLEKESTQAKDKLKDLLSDFDQKLQSLKSKQQKIVQFEQKVNQLQKKKHILSYKATEMKKAIQPKDFQIQKLKSDLIKLKKQFQASLQRKQKANLYLQKLNKEKQHLDKCYNQQKQKTLQQANLIDQVLLDIYFCLQKNRVGSLQAPNKPQPFSSSSNPNLKPQSQPQPQPAYDHKIYFKQLIRLYHKYVQNQSTGPNPSFNSDKSMDEVTKQIVHLEKSLFQVNKSNEKNILRKNDEIFKRTKENTELINNLNQLKKQNKEFVLKIKSKNLQIEGLKAVKTELLSSCPKTSGTLVFKLMNGEEVSGNEVMGYSSVKKVGGNSLLGSSVNNPNSNNSSNNNTTNTRLNPNRQRSVRNLPLNLSSSNNTQQSSMKPQASNYKKRQCQIISQIQFITQRIHKFQFYLKDMEGKLIKHVNLAGCEVGREIVEGLREE